MTKKNPYVKKRKLYKLTFEDEEYEGLEVIAKGLTLGDFLEYSKVLDKMSEEDAEEEQILELLSKFASCVVSWNLEAEGDVEGESTPIPKTYEGLLSLDDPEFVLLLLHSWMGALTGIPDPLDEKSNSGEQFPEDSIPMETLSVSQAS